MPLYEFCCRECGHQFEVIVSLGGEGTVRCPKCNAPEPKRLLSLFATGQGSSAGSGVRVPSPSSCGPSSSPFS